MRYIWRTLFATGLALATLGFRPAFTLETEDQNTAAQTEFYTKLQTDTAVPKRDINAAWKLDLTGQKKQRAASSVYYVNIYYTKGDFDQWPGFSLTPFYVMQPFSITADLNDVVVFYVTNEARSGVYWASMEIQGYPSSYMTIPQYSTYTLQLKLDQPGNFYIMDRSFSGSPFPIAGYLYVRNAKVTK